MPAIGKKHTCLLNTPCRLIYNKAMEIQAKRVMVAMSGGVDSSVCALLLRDAGFDVVGMTAFLADRDGHEADLAKGVCAILGIEHVSVDLTSEFEQDVITRFCSTYLTGGTPNPCVTCNRLIKFGEFDRIRKELGADKVATGHYARNAYDGRTKRWRLLRGVDAKKDQSYFLGQLSQGQLSNALFPLGELTKDEVRTIAKDAGLGCESRKESQDICFIADGDYAGFIGRHIGSDRCPHDLSSKYEDATTPGDIVDADGNALGRHGGLLNYTIGQRKGIGVAAAAPLYVIGKDMGANRLIVGTRESSLTCEVGGKDVNYIALAPEQGDDAGRLIQVRAKATYRAKPMPAKAAFEGDHVKVVFDDPIMRPAPGQLLAVYDMDGEDMLASAVIC